MEQKPKVGLIIPPSPFLCDERVFPALGILKVAAVLEQKGYPVAVLDLNGVENYLDCLLAFLDQERDMAHIGITVTTPQVSAVYRMVPCIALNSSAKIILGGAHITSAFASLRMYEKGRGNDRGKKEVEHLLNIADVLVAGDGEFAIEQALQSDAWFVDADNPDSIFFLSDRTLDTLPFPARHLIDLESYHYRIEGHKAGSLIGQLGCLAAGTAILMSNGKIKPIELVQRGDYVQSYNVDTHKIENAPVCATWKRQANDLWELTFDNGTTLLVTGEHPLWTPQGWKSVENVKTEQTVGSMPWMSSILSSQNNSRKESKILQQRLPQSANTADLPNLREDVFTISCFCKADQLLFEGLPGRIPASISSRTRSSPGAESHEGQMGLDVPRGAAYAIEHQTIAQERTNSKSQEDLFRNKKRRSQPNEKSGSGAESFRYHENPLGAEIVRPDQSTVERGINADALAAGQDSAGPQQARAALGQYFAGRTSNVPLRREWAVLGRPLSFRQTSEPGFCRHQRKAGDSTTWGILAQSRGCGDPEIGLRRGRVASPNYLGKRAATEKPQQSDESAPIIWTKLISKKLVGKSQVYNITVHPYHNYIANNLLVHNCPYNCSFCSGRLSPSFRRIRTRSAQHIVAEMQHLHETYNYTGFMLSDDELNIPTNFNELMHEIIALQERLGVEFRLRGFIKANLFTAEQARLMYAAGFRQLLTGFESGSDRILKNIEKKSTKAQNTRCMEIAHQYGLKVKALMSLGHAGETAETARATHDWLLAVQPDDFDCTIITVYPGTPYHDFAQPHPTQAGVWTFTAKNGDRLHFYDIDFAHEDAYYKGSPGEYQSFVFTDALKSEDLVHLRDWIETDVRQKLGLPFHQITPAMKFEASMGQLPGHLYRRSTMR